MLKLIPQMEVVTPRYSLVVEMSQLDTLDGRFFDSNQLVNIFLILLQTQLQILTASVVSHQNQPSFFVSRNLDFFIHPLKLLVLLIVEEEALLHGLQVPGADRGDVISQIREWVHNKFFAPGSFFQ